MKTKFAVNYSNELENLVKAGFDSIDLYKLPAWPQEASKARNTLPLYIHFPLLTGRDIYQSIKYESEKIGASIDLHELIETYEVDKVNLHISVIDSELPDIPQGAIDRESTLKVTRYIIDGCQQAIEIFGMERVILENNIQGLGYLKAACCLPEVINEVVHETGCGFLFDLSHARLSAAELGLDECEYISGLPTDQLDELHLTGIQILDNNWMKLIRNKAGGIPIAEKFAGHAIDHLPFTVKDWEMTQWAVDQIKAGTWKQPRIAACEYGGVGDGFFSATVDQKVLVEQIPRLYEMIQEINQL